jgi:hypothetical protein
LTLLLKVVVCASVIFLQTPLAGFAGGLGGAYPGWGAGAGEAGGVADQIDNIDLGTSGADILTTTTSTFRSDTFGSLGPPLSMQVTIEVLNDTGTDAGGAGLVSVQFCTIGAATVSGPNQSQ